LRLELGIARCELDLSAEINSPATCYWWRPHVLLPAEIVSRLDDDQLHDVLRHELLHVKRKDYLWDRIAALGCRLVFFHPLAWLGYRHLRWERELACDHAVVRESAEARLRYAECLTMLARWLMERKRFSPGISLFSSESLLAVRVRSLLREPRAYSVPCAVARTGLATIVGIITLLFTPGIGLSFYSPIHLTKLLANGNVIPSHARKKAIGVRHAFALTSADPDTSLHVQDTMPEPTTILSVFPPKALPVLSSSPAIEAATETDSHVDKGDVNLSRSVWDEAPAPLATAPKWRTFAIKAITRGIGAAASRVGVDDDDDGPRRRSR
jgi:hypothetical protein